MKKITPSLALLLVLNIAFAQQPFINHLENG